MKPFDLQKAIDGHSLVTRDGHDVTEFHYFKTRTHWKVNVIIDGELYSVNDEGRYSCGTNDSEFDLFLKSEKKKLFIGIRREANVYGNNDLSSYAYQNPYLADNPLQWQVVEVEIDA